MPELSLCWTVVVLQVVAVKRLNKVTQKLKAQFDQVSDPGH